MRVSVGPAGGGRTRSPKRIESVICGCRSGERRGYRAGPNARHPGCLDAESDGLCERRARWCNTDSLAGLRTAGEARVPPRSDLSARALRVSLGGSAPGCIEVVSLLKRWLLGTHQGGVSPQHLDYHLGEFTFRFNRRHSFRRGRLFYWLVQQAVALPTSPWSAAPRTTIFETIRRSGPPESSRYPSCGIRKIIGIDAGVVPGGFTSATMPRNEGRCS
jgi:hypothetical protein